MPKYLITLHRQETVQHTLTVEADNLHSAWEMGQERIMSDDTDPITWGKEIIDADQWVSDCEVIDND